jgi:hypothetical protein
MQAQVSSGRAVSVISYSTKPAPCFVEIFANNKITPYLEERRGYELSK